MRGESQRLRIGGHLLHRMVMHPEDEVSPRAEAIFYHGQGDYAERYLDLLVPFTAHGIRCTVTELPGHGESSGRRGHAGNEALLDQIIGSMISDIEKRGGLPYGVMGHSMGGLLAARHLALAGQGLIPSPRFAWLSSPLVKPAEGRARFFVLLVRLLALISPSVTFSTRVNRGDRAVDGSDSANESPDNPLPKHPLWHNRISMGWASCLVDFARLVRESIRHAPADVPLLLTQGSEDPVCPPALARKLFEDLPMTQKHYVELEGLLHDPFRGDGADEFYLELGRWLGALKL